MEDKEKQKVNGDIDQTEKDLCSLRCFEFNNCKWLDQCKMRDHIGDPNAKCWLIAGDMDKEHPHEPTCKGFILEILDTCEDCNYHRAMDRIDETIKLLKQIKELVKEAGVKLTTKD